MNKIKNLFLLLLITGFIYGCNNKTKITKQKATEFFETFNKREDFEKFLSFYDQDAVLEDIVNADRIKGIEELRNFFNWNNPGFNKIGDSTLVVEDIIVNKNKTVVRGHFTPFKWDNNTYNSMYFVTILTFNDSGKIIRHIDWINYPSTIVDYNKRKDSNKWINEK